MKNYIGILGLGSPDRVFRSEIPNTYYISNKKDLVAFLGYNPVDIINGINSNDLFSDLYLPEKFEFDFAYHYISSGYIKSGTKTEKMVNTSLKKVLEELRKNYVCLPF